MNYKKTQFSWMIFWFTVPVVAVISLMAIVVMKQLPTEMLVPLVILLLVLMIFRDLTVTVDEKEVGIKFGVGWIHKEFKLADIESCKEIKNSAWLGWGIRFGRGFILYNVSGYDAVELTFKDGRRKVRIGTAEPAELCAAIRTMLEPQELMQ